jgi:hypothetical protein
MSSLVYEITCIVKKLTKEQLVETAVSFGFDEKEAKRKTTTKADLAQYCIPRMKAFFDNEIYEKKKSASPKSSKPKSPLKSKSPSKSSKKNFDYEIVEDDMVEEGEIDEDEESGISISNIYGKRSMGSADSIGDTGKFYNIRLQLYFIPSDEDGMNNISEKSLDKFLKENIQDWIYDDSMSDDIIEDEQQKNVFIPSSAMWNNKLSIFDAKGKMIPTKSVITKLKTKDIHLWVPRYVLYVKDLFFGSSYDRIRQIIYEGNGMLNISIAKTTKKDLSKEIYNYLKTLSLEDGAFEGAPGSVAVYPDPSDSEKEYGLIDYRESAITIKVE